MGIGKDRHGKVQAIIERDRARIARRIELLCALALTILIAILHLHRVTLPGSLWRDEITTLNIATLPSLSQLWFSLIYITPPILPYGIVRLWTGIHWLGGGDTSLRMLGMLEGTGILAILWINAKLLGYQTPVVCLVLFGLNPFVIQWGDSPRGYGLGSLLILLVYGLVWTVVESPTPLRVMLATLAAILSVQCLFQNAPLLFAICLGGALVCLRLRLWERMLVVFGIGAISALSLTPYLPIIEAYQSLNVIIRTTIDFSWILIALANTLAAGTSFLLLPWIICSAIAAHSAGHFIFAKQKDRSEEGRMNLAIFSLTVLVSGIVAFIAFSKAVGLQINPWHCVPLIGPLVLSIEVLIELTTTTIPRRLVRLVVALLVAGLTIPFTWSQSPIRQSNIDIIATKLQERTSHRDLVVVNPWYMGITFQHYYRGQTHWMTLPPMSDSTIHRPDLLREQMELEQPLQPVFDAMETVLKSGNRVWVVGDFAAQPDGRPTPSLPLASIGSTGWSSGDYKRKWTQQLGYFIDSHALEREQMDLEITQPVNPFENPPLRVFKGWRP